MALLSESKSNNLGSMLLRSKSSGVVVTARLVAFPGSSFCWNGEGGGCDSRQRSLLAQVPFVGDLDEESLCCHRPSQCTSVRQAPLNSSTDLH